MDSKERFSNRVSEYRKYRPGYPDEVVEILKSVCGFGERDIAADVGSGTGIMTRMLLPHCRLVYAIEPNAEMRHAAESLLVGNSNFVSVDASAESTTLKDNTVDLVVSAQAFHWFDRTLTKAEFRRILRNDGWIALIWNSRSSDIDEFHKALESLLLELLPDYSTVKHRNIEPNGMSEFFSPCRVTYRRLSNKQILDWTAFKGRLLSASYVPKEGERHHDDFMVDVKRLFDTFETNGKISLKYVTEMYMGQLENVMTDKG